jgi:hypothetical protein
MRRTAIEFTVMLLLCVGLCGPALQNVDPWDSFPDTGDSALLILAMAAMWFGMTLCLALLIPLLFKQARTPRCLLVSAQWARSLLVFLPTPIDFDSPQPLRI